MQFALILVDNRRLRENNNKQLMIVKSWKEINGGKQVKGEKKSYE